MKTKWQTNHLARVILLLCATVGMAQAREDCEVYPIALSSISLLDAVPGGEIIDFYRDKHPENCTFFVWSGRPDMDSLVKSLTPPGDSASFVNARDADDQVLSVGDWVSGKIGVSNSIRVRDRLDVLQDQDIIVPVWDESHRQHDQEMQFHISAFAKVRLLNYDLPKNGRITLRFLGYVSCGEE